MKNVKLIGSCLLVIYYKAAINGHLLLTLEFLNFYVGLLSYVLFDILAPINIGYEEEWLAMMSEVRGIRIIIR